MQAIKNEYPSIVEGWDIIGICNEAASVSTASLTNVSATEIYYKFLFCLFSKNEYWRGSWGHGGFNYFSPSILTATT